MYLDALGIQKAKLNQFEKKGIQTIDDLAMYFPKKYYDFRHATKIKNVQHDKIVAIIGEIKEVKNNIQSKMVQAKIADGSGSFLYVTWFQQPFVVKFLREGCTYIFCGKVTIDKEYGRRNMVNPFRYGMDIENHQKIVPMYSKIQGMSDDFLQKSIQSALNLIGKEETIEKSVMERFGLMNRKKAIQMNHEPIDDHILEKARYRMMFEDLFQFALQMEGTSYKEKDAYPFPKCSERKGFLSSLPFELTDGQREALRTIYLKMRKGEQVNALVQGDVGCGKTIVAIILMLIASENGYQSTLMAPTNVLAKQHYQDLVEKTKGTSYQVAYLSGDMKAKEKKQVLAGLKDGSIHMVVGTHAVLSKEVQFHKLGLTVVDEEHRFGVIQRNALKEKAKQGIHHVSMSATPIPRSLALGLYGDSVDVLTIMTLPKGRQPVKTIQHSKEEMVYEAMYRQIKEGRQCYVVCPLIDDSDNETLQDVDSVETTYKKIQAYFEKNDDVSISMITGKMKPDVIESELNRFSRNETQILISTTIIEVGVNVPNATVIVIKNAERFGLAQLHQLRGRVGRGSHASYCVLLSKKANNPKLKAMCQTTSGFEIAEKDLELRGMGDFIGTKQTGENKYVMLMMSNLPLYEQIKAEVKAIYQDPNRLGYYRFLDVVDFKMVTA